MLKKVAYLLIIYLLFLTACQSSDLPVTNSFIFFTFEGHDNWEIWRMNRDGTSPNLIYKIPHKLDFLSAQQQKIISPEIANTLKNDKYTPLKDNSLLMPELLNITLSPNKHFLALFEILFQCREDSCHIEGNFIQFTIKILDLETNTIIATFTTSDYVGSPSWSPDSKYVVFDQSPSDRYTVEQTSQIILLNVQNSEYTKLGLGSEPSFSKNENRIVSYKLTDKFLTSCCQVINLPEKTIKDVVATQPDTFSIVLSPNGKTIAGLTRKEQDNYPFLVDLDTSHNQILDAPLKENSLGNNIIKWSPDGRHLSVSTIDPLMVTVLDLSGNIQLSLENVYEWEWSNSGDQILYVRRYNNGCRQVEPYFYTITLANKNVSRIDLPPSIKKYLSLKVFEMACYTGIGSVTW